MVQCVDLTRRPRLAEDRAFTEAGKQVFQRKVSFAKRKWVVGFVWMNRVGMPVAAEWVRDGFGNCKVRMISGWISCVVEEMGCRHGWRLLLLSQVLSRRWLGYPRRSLLDLR